MPLCSKQRVRAIPFQPALFLLIPHNLLALPSSRVPTHLPSPLHRPLERGMRGESTTRMVPKVNLSHGIIARNIAMEGTITPNLLWLQCQHESINLNFPPWRVLNRRDRNQQRNPIHPNGIPMPLLIDHIVDRVTRPLHNDHLIGNRLNVHGVIPNQSDLNLRHRVRRRTLCGYSTTITKLRKNPLHRIPGIHLRNH